MRYTEKMMYSGKSLSKPTLLRGATSGMVGGSGSDVHAVFSKISQQYDSFNALSSLGVYRHWLRMLAAEAKKFMQETAVAKNPLAGARTAEGQLHILDIAGGTGEVSFELCRQLPGAQIALSDFCKPMLDVAAQRIAKGEITRVQASRIQLVQADACKLPFANASFQLATCAYGIRNMLNRELALSEAYRVLKPGGCLLVCEFSHPPLRVWRRLYQLYLNRVVPAIGGRITGDKEAFYYLRDSIQAFPDQIDFCEMLLAAGFADISYRNLTGGIVALHKAVK